MDRVRRRAIDEGIGVEVPHRLAIGVADHRIGQGGEETAHREFAIARAVGREHRCCCLLRGGGRFGGGGRPLCRTLCRLGRGTCYSQHRQRGKPRAETRLAHFSLPLVPQR